MNYSKFDLRRYFKLHPMNTYGWYVWTLHYLGIARVSYDTKMQQWRVLPNAANPLLIPFVIVTAAAFSVWNGLKSMKKTNFHRFFTELWEKRENGSWRFIPYRRAPKLPLDPETKESIKKRRWAKKFL